MQLRCGVPASLPFAKRSGDDRDGEQGDNDRQHKPRSATARGGVRDGCLCLLGRGHNGRCCWFGWTARPGGDPDDVLDAGAARSAELGSRSDLSAARPATSRILTFGMLLAHGCADGIRFSSRCNARTASVNWVAVVPNACEALEYVESDAERADASERTL